MGSDPPTGPGGRSNGEIFGDVVVAAAMIDRLVHHAGILSLKGDSYRLRDKDVATRSRPALIDES